MVRNRLAGTRAYLAGAMDRAPDRGVGWRQFLRTELDDLQISWLDPTRKPIDFALEDEASHRRRYKAKERGDWAAIGAEMNQIRRIDLRMCDISDFVVLHIDVEVHACGSYEEAYLSNRQKKPVLVHVSQGKKACPDWLWGVFPAQHIFGAWDELTKYVRHIAHDDEIDTLKRWLFFHPSVRKV